MLQPTLGMNNTPRCHRKAGPILVVKNTSSGDLFYDARLRIAATGDLRFHLLGTTATGLDLRNWRRLLTGILHYSVMCYRGSLETRWLVTFTVIHLIVATSFWGWKRLASADSEGGKRVRWTLRPTTLPVFKAPGHYIALAILELVLDNFHWLTTRLYLTGSSRMNSNRWAVDLGNNFEGDLVLAMTINRFPVLCFLNSWTFAELNGVLT